MMNKAMKNPSNSSSQRWGMYSFFLNLLVHSDKLVLKLASLGILAITGSLVSLAILEPIRGVLTGTCVTAAAVGMALFGRFLWLDTQGKEISFPWALFLCAGLIGMSGGLAVLTQLQDVSHFLRFFCLVVGSCCFVMALWQAYKASR
jgi:hypothetical protein